LGRRRCWGEGDALVSSTFVHAQSASTSPHGHAQSPTLSLSAPVRNHVVAASSSKRSTLPPHFLPPDRRPTGRDAGTGCQTTRQKYPVLDHLENMHLRLCPRTAFCDPLRATSQYQCPPPDTAPMNVATDDVGCPPPPPALLLPALSQPSRFQRHLPEGLAESSGTCTTQLPWETRHRESPVSSSAIGRSCAAPVSVPCRDPCPQTWSDAAGGGRKTR
jgi:hypothetical protein